MKTRIHITAIFLALMMAPALMNAQTARRSDTRESTQRSTIKSSQQREKTSQKARTSQSDRQVQRSQPKKQQMTRQRTTPPSRQQAMRHQSSQPDRHVSRQRASQPAGRDHKNSTKREEVMRHSTIKQQAGRTRVTQPENRHRDHVSVTNNRNPRSTYRSPDTHRHARPNKYSTKRYYSGHHYHHVHPSRRIKLHYHHDTYVHNYHVLYYPRYREIYWTRHMYRDYRRWYPNYHWRYDYGYRIRSISVFDAKYNLGEVAMVYGRVYATWHNRETDDFLLFFGGDYPHQQFTVVLPGQVARRFSWRPERYFLGEHMTVTGLITTYNGIPEIIVKNKRQVGIY